MAAVENIEWLNQNQLRAYPIREDADTTPRTSNGSVATGLKIPTCLITDFSFTIAFAEVDADSVPTLTGLTHTAGGFSFEFSAGNTVLATKTIAFDKHTVNKTYRLTGQGDNADFGGWLTVGDMAKAAEELPEGAYRFEPGQVPFEVSTLRMMPRGVRSITAVGKYGLRTYAPLTGAVKIIAGSDMRVLNSAAANAIWLQAESGTGYERTAPCVCGTAGVQNVESINGMSVKDIKIIGDKKCITVEKTEDPVTFKVSDTCSTPCCGCAELNFVETAVATLNKSLATLTSYADALRQKINELSTNREVTNAAINAYPKSPLDPADAR